MENKAVIIGAGVGGMTLAIYLKRAGVNFSLIEEKRPGGQINFALSVENFPSYSKISGRELSSKIFEQVKELVIDYIKDKVLSIKKEKDNFSLQMKSGDVITCNTIFIATGKHVKRLDIPNVNDYLGCGLSYCATCDGAFFKNKDVIVVGDNNDAVKDAMYLAAICKNVTILVSGNELSADKFYQDKLSTFLNVKISYNTILKRLIKDNVLKQAEIVDAGVSEIINVDGCFASVGYVPDSEIFKDLVKLDGDNYIVVDSNMKTSCDGVYAIGDVNNRKVFQLVSAMDDAVVASKDYLKNVN